MKYKCDFDNVRVYDSETDEIILHGIAPILGDRIAVALEKAYELGREDEHVRQNEEEDAKEN